MWFPLEPPGLFSLLSSLPLVDPCNAARAGGEPHPCISAEASWKAFLFSALPVFPVHVREKLVAAGAWQQRWARAELTRWVQMES